MCFASPIPQRPSPSFSLSLFLFLPLMFALFSSLPLSRSLPSPARGIGKNKINCSTYPIRWQSRCPGDADSLLSSMLSGGARDVPFLFLPFYPLSSLSPPRWPSLARHNFLRSSMTSERRTELGKKRVGTGPARPSRLSLSCLATGSRSSSARRATRRSILLCLLVSYTLLSSLLHSPHSYTLLYSALLCSTLLCSALLSSRLLLLLRSASFFAATA